MKGGNDMGRIRTTAVRLLSLALFLAFGLAPASAHAATYNTLFCFDYGVDFDDASTSVGDDYWTSNSDKTARGARVQVTRLADSTDVYDDYTDYNGTYAGCTSFIGLDSNAYYRVRIFSEAEVGGNYVEVYDDDSTENLYFWEAEKAYKPTSPEIRLHTTPVAEHWNIAAAAGYSQYRRRGGLTGETYILYNEFCSGSSGSCTKSSGKMYISDYGDDRKYIIVHEMGHALGIFKNGASTSFSYSATLDNCYTDSGRSHEIVSKEYQSAAANEGWAHFYAAVIFNNDGASSCGFEYYKSVDFDLDSSNDDRTISCEGRPNPGIGDGYDYLGDWCNGTLTNRGTEYDWLRFWWDFTTDQDVYFTQCADIWDTADPNDWNATGSGTGSDYPSSRLRDAADTEGYLTEWDAEDNLNGVHR